MKPLSMTSSHPMFVVIKQLNGRRPCRPKVSLQRQMVSPDFKVEFSKVCSSAVNTFQNYRALMW
jgi:hypothetical protein